MKPVTITITASFPDDVTDAEIQWLAMAAKIQVEDPEDIPSPTNVKTDVDIKHQ